MSLRSFRGRSLRRIALLAFGLLAVSLHASLHAQPIPSAAERLDPVVVSATRTPTRVSDTVAEVTVLDRAAIDRATGRTLVELLAQQPGLQFSSNGGLGKTASLFIRGLEARHTLLLLDGVRVSSETVGSPSLDNLPLETIDRIEIVRGPMSSLYGNAAMGGVIQVFTRRGREGLHPNARLTAGSNRYGQIAGGVAIGQGGFDAAVQVQHTETRGFSATNAAALFGSFDPDADGFNQDGGSLRMGWQIAPDWRAEVLAVESNGVTQYDDGPGVDARATLRNSIQSLQANGRIGGTWHTRFAVARSVDVYDTLSSASPFATLGPISTVQRQFTWENTLATRVGTALALLERIEQDVSRPDVPYDVSGRTIDAIGIGLSGASAGHAWQASARHDRNSQFGSKNTGAVAWGYAVAPAWRVGASYGTSFVAPSFNQLYYPGFGNPDLQSEQGRHAELSLRWAAGEHSVRAAWFDNRYRNFIPSGPLPSNVPRARSDGVALTYEGRWDDVALGASFDHVDPRNATDGVADEGKQLPRRAKNAFKAQADWSSGAYSAGATLAMFSQRFDDPANTLRMAGYGTLDLRAEWAFRPDWSVGARLNNVAGEVYETSYGYNQPGREAYLTLRYAPR
jgi:vitamin B12 transporter